MQAQTSQILHGAMIHVSAYIIDDSRGHDPSTCIHCRHCKGQGPSKCVDQRPCKGHAPCKRIHHRPCRGHDPCQCRPCKGHDPCKRIRPTLVQGRWSRSCEPVAVKTVPTAEIQWCQELPNSPTLSPTLLASLPVYSKRFLFVAIRKTEVKEVVSKMHAIWTMFACSAKNHSFGLRALQGLEWQAAVFDLQGIRHHRLGLASQALPPRRAKREKSCVLLCFPPASSENCAHPWLWALALPLATWTPSWELFSARNFCYVHQDGLALLVALPGRVWDLQVKGLDTWASECSASVAAMAAAISRASSNS